MMFVSAEAGRHLLAVHSPAPPPPRALRGDHRPKVQQVRPEDELRNLRVVLHPITPLRDRNNTKMAACYGQKKLFPLFEDTTKVARVGPLLGAICLASRLQLQL